MIYNSNTFTLKLTLFAVIASLIFFPVFGFAAGLVPCDGTLADPCDFATLITLIQNVIDFLLFQIVMPLSAIMFAIAGVMLLTARDNEGQISTAKGIFWSVLFGILIMLAAWLIVRAISAAVLNTGFSFLGP